MKKNMRGIKLEEKFPLEGAINKLLKKHGIKKTYNANIVLFNWGKIVGEKVAENSYPTSIDKGILKLRVKNSAWSHHLMMMKKEIINNINTYINDNLVKDVFLNAGYYEEKKKYLYGENIDDAENKITPALLDETEILEVKERTKKIKNNQIKNKIDYIILKQKALEKAKKINGWQKCLLCETLVEPENKYCFNCNLSINRNKTEKIEEIFIQKSLVSYEDASKYFDLSEEEYNNIKKSLTLKLIRILLKENYEKNADLEDLLARLLSKNKKLSKEKIEQTIEKIRIKFGKKEE